MQKPKWILTLAAAVVLLLPGPSRTNPPVNPANTFDAIFQPPPQVADILHRACYDCHSNHTGWPWYSRVGPGAWLIARDVQKGRAALNFTDWSHAGTRTPNTVTATLLLAACTGIKSGRMPKAPYPLLHPDARLSLADRDLFCAWATSQANHLFARHRVSAAAGEERTKRQMP